MKSILTNKCTSLQKTKPRKNKWKRFGSGFLPMFLASAILSVQTQVQAVPSIQYFGDPKNIDVAGSIQLSYGAARLSGSPQGRIQAQCYNKYSQHIIDKETNMLGDADNQVYFLQLVPASGDVGLACSPMNLVDDFTQQLNLNLDGPMNVQATYKKTSQGYLSGINFQTSSLTALGFQSECGSDDSQTESITLTTGELEIGSAVLSAPPASPENFRFVDPYADIIEECNHMWKITYSSNVILLGTNGSLNSANEFDVFGIYYRFVNLQELNWSAITQTITVQTTDGSIQLEMLELQSKPVTPSPTPSILYEIAHLDPANLDFNGLTTQISINVQEKKISLPDLTNVVPGIYKFTVTAKESVGLTIQASYTLEVIVEAPFTLSFAESLVTVERERGLASAISIQTLTMTPTNPSPAPSLVYTLTGDLNFAGQTTSQLNFHAQNPPTHIDLPSTAEVAINTIATVIITVRDTNSAVMAQYNLKIKVVPLAQCTTAALYYDTNGATYAINLARNREYDSSNTLARWQWSRPVAGCDIVYSCSTSPATIDLCSSGKDLTITITKNVETSGIYLDTFEWSMNTVDKVTYPPGVYTMTLIVNLVDKPSESFTHKLTLTLTDTCDQQIQVSAIPNQEIYVGDSALTFQVTSTDLPVSCTLSKVYAFSNTSVSSWMTIDANGLITLQATDLSLRGTYMQTVSVSLPGYEAKQGQATFSVVIKTCDDLTLSVPATSPFNPSSYTYNLQGPTLAVSLPTTDPYVSLSYSLDCGRQSVNFLQSKDGSVSSALDSAIFTQDAGKITIATSDESKLGTYVIEYDASLENYPSVPAAKLTSAFTVTILAYYEMNFVNNEVQKLSPDPFGGVFEEPIRSLVLQPTAPSPTPTILYTITDLGQGLFFSGGTSEPITINASQQIVTPDLINVAPGTYTFKVIAKDSVYPDSIKAEYNLEIYVFIPFSFAWSLEEFERQVGNSDPISLQELVNPSKITGLVYSLTGALDFDGQTATELAFDNNESPTAILVPSTINVSGPFPVTAVLVIKVTQTGSQAYAQYEVRISIPEPILQPPPPPIVTPTDTCDQQISVSTIPNQEIYVGNSTSTFQVTSTELPASCTLSKVYSFSDTSVSSWMTIDANGLITLQATDLSLRGTYMQTVSVSLPGYEAKQGQATFSVVVKICSSLTVNSDYQIQGSEYTLGSGVVQLAYVEKQKSDCNSTHLTLTPSFAELGPAFNLTQIEQGWIKLRVEANSTKELTLGSHAIKISEVDAYSGFKASTTIRFNVLPNPTQPSFAGVDILNLNQTERNSTEPIADISDDKQDNNQTEVSNQVKTTEDDIDQSEELNETATSKTILFEPEVYIDENGEITYPWQTKIKLQRRERQKFKIVNEEEIVPLKASVQSLSPTGNLTIAFNKPLILPPIRVDDYSQVTNSSATEARLLQEEVSSYKYDIKDVVDLKIESSFHTEDSSIIKIKDYNLTRLTETAMDIQIEFQHPDLLTQSAQEPDAIKIQFKKEGMFMDELDLLQLDSDLEVMFAIQPQKTAEEIEALEKLGEDMASSMTTLSIVIIILQFFLAMGLKYLWNIMNLLQFLIFMQTWQILLPSTTSIVLKQLKILALGEFLPTDFLKSTLKRILGLEQDQEDYSCADQECEISSKADEEKSIAEEETGIDRIGSNDLIDNMGAMLEIAATLVLTILILVLLGLIAKKCPCAKKAYVSIKKKLFYNTFLRYVLQGTLKLQIAAGTVIGYDILKSQEDETETSTISKVFSWITIVVLNLCPFLFFLVVMRNQSNLDKPVIRESIGTLYNGLRTSSTGTKSYCFVFLVRRTLFVLITFLLFSQPGIQVQLMIYMTLMYVIYLGHSEFFEQFSSKSMEIFNESVFVLIQYCFVLLANLVWEQTIRTRIGEIIIALTAILLVLNMLLIIVVSIKALCWNLHLKKLKKQHAALMLERQKAKEIQQRQQIERLSVLKAVREAQQEEAKVVVRNVSSSSESQSYDQSSSSISISKEKSSDQSEISQEIAKIKNVEVVAKMQNKDDMLPIGLTSVFQPKEEQKLKQIELKLKSSSSSRLGMNSLVSTYGRQSSKSVLDLGFLANSRNKSTLTATQSSLGLRNTGSVTNYSRWPSHMPNYAATLEKQDIYLQPNAMPSTFANKEIRIKSRNNEIARHQSEPFGPPTSFAESFQNIPIRIRNQHLPATRTDQETPEHALKFD